MFIGRGRKEKRDTTVIGVVLETGLFSRPDPRDPASSPLVEAVKVRQDNGEEIGVALDCLIEAGRLRQR